jgi:hypothetical protein
VVNPSSPYFFNFFGFEVKFSSRVWLKCRGFRRISCCAKKPPLAYIAQGIGGVRQPQVATAAAKRPEPRKARFFAARPQKMRPNLYRIEAFPGLTGFWNKIIYQNVKFVTPPA